ncbi:SUN domain-containing protein 2 isoform X1 [Pleurodeles waltl]
MSRRSTRLQTSRYYQGDEDDRASTSSAGSSLLGGSQALYKESPVRTFRKKSGSVKRSTLTMPPDTHQSSSYYHETTYVSGGISSADYNSILEDPLEKETYWEKDLARQRRVTGDSYSVGTTNGLADTKVTYDTYGSSSGYSSEEDYTGHALSQTSSSGSGFTGAVSKAGSLLWQVVTSPGQLFGLLYWWVGTAWYRLTTSASLLDVFVLTRNSSGLKKALLLLLLLLLLAATAFGAWHFFPLVLGALRPSSAPAPVSPAVVPPILVSTQTKEDGNASLMYQHLMSRLENLESRFQSLTADSTSWRREESAGQTTRDQLLDAVAGRAGLSHEEAVVLLEQMMSRREAELRQDLSGASAVHLKGELNTLREEQQCDLKGVLKQMDQLSTNMESQMQRMKTELKSPSQEDQKETFLQEIARLEEQLTRVQLELRALADSQRGIAAQVELLPGQIQGMQDEIEQQFPEWVQRLLLPVGTSGTGSLSGVFLRRDELQEQLLDLERRILAAAKEEQKRSPQHASARVGVVLQGGALSGVTEEDVHQIVNRALSRFSEDRIGLVDYALESSGASVLSTRCSETYETKTALLSLFGIPLWYQSQSPRVILQPDSNPGNCWAFRGSQGFAVVRLSSRIRPTAVSLEHIPRSLSPKGSIPSAPKDFAIYGHEEEAPREGTFLGQFTYDQDAEPIQTFWFQEEPLATYQIVELKILSNWGHPEYTCIYRFRVHGEPEE